MSAVCHACGDTLVAAFISRSMSIYQHVLEFISDILAEISMVEEISLL